jgi:hypothetical protein
MILVLRSNHLSSGLLALLLGAESRIESLFLVVNWVKGVKYPGVPVALYLNIVKFILNNCHHHSSDVTYLQRQTFSGTRHPKK